MSNELEIRLVAGRAQRDRARVVDRAAQRQHGIIAQHNVADVVGDRGLIEHEVASGERCCIDAVQRDRLAVAKCDHRIAVCTIGQMHFDVAETGDGVEAGAGGGVGCGGKWILSFDYVSYDFCSGT